MVKNLPANATHTRRRFNPRVGKISWRSKWLPTPVFLSGKSHGQRGLEGYHPWGYKASDTTKLASQAHTHTWTAMPYVKNHTKDQGAQKQKNKTNNVLGTGLEKSTGLEVRRSMLRLHSAGSWVFDQRPTLNSPKPVKTCNEKFIICLYQSEDIYVGATYYSVWKIQDNYRCEVLFATTVELKNTALQLSPTDLQTETPSTPEGPNETCVLVLNSSL